MEEQKPLAQNAPIQQNNSLTILEELNPQQLAFFFHLKQGKKVPVAYKEAGYEGNDHAAYQLKSRLNKQYQQFLMETSMGESDWLQRLDAILDKPLVRYGQFGNVYDVPGITMDQYIKVLALQQKHIEIKKQNEKPTISSITINRFAGNSMQHNQSATPLQTNKTGQEAAQVNVVDAELVEPKENDSKPV